LSTADELQRKINVTQSIVPSYIYDNILKNLIFYYLLSEWSKKMNEIKSACTESDFLVRPQRLKEKTMYNENRQKKFKN